MSLLKETMAFDWIVTTKEPFELKQISRWFPIDEDIREILLLGLSKIRYTMEFSLKTI